VEEVHRQYDELLEAVRELTKDGPAIEARGEWTVPAFWLFTVRACRESILRARGGEAKGGK
jgi:hypothetical protein